MELKEMGKKAKEASRLLAQMTSRQKNQILEAAAKNLLKYQTQILEANQADIKQAKSKGIKESLQDRLLLTEERIEAMAESLREIADLEDPVGEVRCMKKRPNGLQIGVQRVPLGVIGMIYESRPNVTVDAFALCWKTGNAVILKGGSDALQSNQCIVELLRMTLRREQVSEDAIQFLTDTDHETVQQMMQLTDYIDVLIPRGGKKLIQTVVQHSTIPVIETGTGNCHIYVDETADISMAREIIVNAKTQRLGVCNACESLVIHRGIAKEAIPNIVAALEEKKVEIRADEYARTICPHLIPATEEDWGMEYLDRIISMKVVDSLEEAIRHINCYNSGHSEAILTNQYENAMRFLNEIDAAAVYVNASTRFTDGKEFGFGAEIGISTQKLHVRGPMGLESLTSEKYIIFGSGQIRS